MPSPAPHSLSLPYPPMADAEFAAFKADIEANGQREPIRLFEGLILDGRHRERACRELGVEPRYEDFTGTPEEAKAAVDSWNLHRRHLTAEFRRERVKELRAKGMSLRQIAATVGTSLNTVQRDLESAPVLKSTPAPPAPPPAVERDPEPAPPEPEPPPPPPPPKVTGLDGKQYPAAKPQKPAARKPPPKPARDEQPESPPQWAAVVESLNQLADRMESVGPIPEEIKPWELVESLERTGRSLLRRALDLRKRHHL